MRVLGSFIFVIFICVNSCDKNYGESYSDFYILTDERDKALFEIVYELKRVSFLGRFGFRDNQIVYGYCKNKTKFSEEVIKSLLSNGLEAGVIHNTKFTYFITKGFFINGNVGILYTEEEDVKRLPKFVFHKLLRKSKYAKGNWYFIQNDIM